GDATVNNDARTGRADFIAFTEDHLGQLSDYLNAPAGVHPADRILPSIARVYFGNDAPVDTSLPAGGLTLKLPAPLLTDSIFGSRSIISSPGDFNGDGRSDIVVAVTLNTTDYGANFAAQGVYIIFGRPGNWSGEIDVVREADVTISGLPGGISVANGGRINGDAVDDLVVGSRFANGGDGAAY